MNSNAFTDFVKLCREKADDQGITRISDEEIERVSGGVGGANEATCPCCKDIIPMTPVSNPYGDDYWTCPKCGTDQIVSDADYIAMVRLMEQYGCPVEYPVWWPLIRR